MGDGTVGDNRAGGPLMATFISLSQL
jgi:hypothetical protein